MFVLYTKFKDFSHIFLAKSTVVHMNYVAKNAFKMKTA